MESRRSIFGSLKSSLSRCKQSSSSSNTQQQAKYVAQPTRRPGEQSDFAWRTNSLLIHHTAAPSTNPFHSASSFDAPPAYSETPDAAPQSAPTPTSSNRRPAPANQTPVVDDQYAFLDEFDTIFLIDDSGSMAGGLWRQTADALMTITPICTAHDEDGVDIYFLNHKPGKKNVVSSAEVQEIFQTVKPGGKTPIGGNLKEIFREYFERYEKNPDTTKPINIICITDGVPTDDVESELIKTARKLDALDAPAWQVGVQFFQVGSDPEATQYLKELDDDLPEIARDKNLRDIVDTVPFLGESGTVLSGAGILKVVLGAVMRRLDRKSKALHQ